MIGSLQDAHKPAPGSTRSTSFTATAATTDTAAPAATEAVAGSAAAGSNFFEQPVPRRFVHRASVAEVLLTGFAEDGRPDTFLLAAQWPRGHSFYRTARGVHDPLLFAETVRQAGLLISHLGYKAPLAHSALMRNLGYDVTAAGLACAGTPTNLILTASCTDVRFRKDVLLGFQITTVLRRGLELEPVGIGRGELQCISPAAYRRLRGGAGAVSPPADPAPLPEPVSPALVGKDARADVVLSRTDADDTWLLRCDTSHPVLFDHPVDHVPGMALIEAMRQAAHCMLYPQRTAMVRLRATFERYVELSEPTSVRAIIEGTEADGSVRVRVELTQSDRQVAVGWCSCRSIV
jgi:2-oxo-3-(phosphooxy)propyl 3-oxoalkanoate synthase